ncbi:MAG: PIN domain-containing protein [Cyanobacteria bacterium SZAS TMP-1]|nr:PIN domain-containing protein [Cyanobacteria bacterium SZAS TMP-1]
MDRNCAVIYDACVLFPAPLRDLLMELGVLSHGKKLFRPKWTDKIHEEWISNLLEEKPHLKQEALAVTRKLMDSAFEGYEPLVTGYEHRIESLHLPDPDDRHVLAAAIECNATIIVTANLKDFPDSQLKQSSVVAKHPDDFICEFLADYEELGERVLEKAVRNIKRRLKNPTMTWNEIFESYDRNGLKRTVEYLKEIIPPSEVIKDDASKISSAALQADSGESSNDQLFQEQLKSLREKKKR